MASYREGEPKQANGIPALDDLIPGKVCGAVLPLSLSARRQLRDRIEVIEYLLHRERVVCN
jgi:hypothetical protein